MDFLFEEGRLRFGVAEVCALRAVVLLYVMDRGARDRHQGVLCECVRERRRGKL